MNTDEKQIYWLIAHAVCLQRVLYWWVTPEVNHCGPITVIQFSVAWAR